MFSWFKSLRAILSRTPPKGEGAPPPPKVWSLLEKFNNNGGGCPDCCGVLYAGPEGGAFVNAECRVCKHRFNIGIVFGRAFFIERVGVPT